jgi:hypothetical protein
MSRRWWKAMGAGGAMLILSWPQASAHHQKEISCEVYSFLDEAGVYTQTVDADRIPPSLRDRVRIERNCALAHDISHAGGLVRPLSAGHIDDGMKWVPWAAGAGVLLAVAAVFVIFFKRRKSRSG